MSKALIVYLIEGILVLPFPLYCIYEERWGAGSSWLPGIGYLLAVPFLALYVASFHGLAAPCYSCGWWYYLVSFLVTTCLCWLGLAYIEGPNIWYAASLLPTLCVSGVFGLLGLLPAYILRG